ncbi:MAG: sensor histidine kinase KdpD [Pleurocapsa minor GSE-CHR-MK-17-07R]|jgi:two-component system sensor histidine kinase KdpD|nr:sensor histidine kinase KdpD [Pleurocapsa minor GSE-CHR-MK 17-07R]
MFDDERPDPDALLAAIQKSEHEKSRGRLRVFLGMAAGVGKTYAMLETARQRKADGLDVVIGYVETHRRPETEALVGGFEVIPRAKLEYRGAVLEEMNVDAVLARAPALVLVDELAHTNAPGSRHAKRYLDVIELLEAGIDVWTTVNVQHFESRADTVQQITGVRVQETLPDSILDLANEIELIDLSPDDLRKRLAEGKVYTAERIETASNNFFRVGNLTALREMALRLTAERVDHQLQDYMAIKRIAGPWKSGERLMVAVGPSPFSEKLIRWTRRMAYNLEASWLAVYVETAQAMSPAAKEQLARNLSLARSLGGEVVTITGHQVSEAVLRLAYQRNVTQIVMGKPQHSRLQTLLRGGSLVDRVIRASGDIDVYVVTGDDMQESTTGPRLLPQLELHSPPWAYITAVLIVSAVTLLDVLLVAALPWLGYQAVGLTELLAVLMIAIYLGRGPALLAALISAVSWNFLFIEPRLTFTISQIQDVLLFFLYFIIAIFAGNLTARVRRQEQLARYTADRTLALYTLAHETATAGNMDDVLRTAVDQIGRIFRVDVAILLHDGSQMSGEKHVCSTMQPDEKELSVAMWVFDHGKPAGRYTDTLPLASAQFFPLLTPNRTVGVMGIRYRQDQRLAADEAALLETFISQVSLVIEREMLDEAAAQSAMLRESERLYTTLLNSISHELRTPIAAIKGAASGLSKSPSASDRGALLHDIHSAADRLNRLVENLLDMSRLESGRLQIKRDWCDIGDIISVAVKNAGACDDHTVDIHLQRDLPLIQVDFVLIEQVVVNLLENACRYGGTTGTIRVSAEEDVSAIRVTVEDDGPGIPADKLDTIFDKFYRVPGTPTGGTGLGLSICKGLVEAHGGSISAENRPQGGARFAFRLPLQGAPPPVKEANL